jgi:hypothetical protein
LTIGKLPGQTHKADTQVDVRWSNVDHCEINISITGIGNGDGNIEVAIALQLSIVGAILDVQDRSGKANFPGMPITKFCSISIPYTRLISISGGGGDTISVTKVK